MRTPINVKKGIRMIRDMLIFQNNNRIGTTWVFWRTIITKRKTRIRMMIVFVFMANILFFLKGYLDLRIYATILVRVISLLFLSKKNPRGKIMKGSVRWSSWIKEESG